MFVFDTSAFINGWRYHYPPAVFPSVWETFKEAMEEERIIVPLEVFHELQKKDDEIAAWIRPWKAQCVEPSARVQAEVGRIFPQIPSSAGRDAADPFVVAEALVRRFAVVTYEGTQLSGSPSKNWAKRMPGVCQFFGVPCVLLPQALGRLGDLY